MNGFPQAKAEESKSEMATLAHALEHRTKEAIHLKEMVHGLLHRLIGDHETECVPHEEHHTALLPRMHRAVNQIEAEIQQTLEMLHRLHNII